MVRFDIGARPFVRIGDRALPVSVGVVTQKQATFVRARRASLSAVTGTEVGLTLAARRGVPFSKHYSSWTKLHTLPTPARTESYGRSLTRATYYH